MSEAENIEIRHLLESTRLFAGLGKDTIQAIASSGVIKAYSPDTYLFLQGDPAERIYILITGRVKLSQVTPEGQNVILRYVGPGEAFSVIAVLAEMKSPVSAEVVEPSRLISWNKDTFKDLMLRFPHLALNNLAVLAARTREFQDRIRELATERVERRIARTILRLARQTGRKVPEGILLGLSITRQEIAELAGTTLFTVSRTISQWENQGVIKAGREEIIILQPHQLVAIAEDLPLSE